MSQENVEVVKALIAAFNRGDAAPDFVIDLSRAVGPARGVYRRDQAVELWSELRAHWESMRIEPHEFIEAGEQVVVPWTFYATGRDGIEVEARVIWTFTVREGVLAQAVYFPTRKEALEAAGLR